MAPPPGPPNKGSGLKWLLVAFAVLLVIAISVGATLLFTRGNGDNSPKTSPSPPTTGASGDIASANDTGPVSVITEDPTCDPWRPISRTIAEQERQGWEKRDPSIPVSAWTPEQRALYDAVAQAMRTAADQTVALAKTTPHRAMRQLYEQTIAYWRAYANSIPTYTERNNDLAAFANTSSYAVNTICGAIQSRVAAARGPLADQSASPANVAPIGNPDDPQPFLSPPPNPTCIDWKATTDQFNTDVADWLKIDPSIPASQWTIEQREVNDRAAVMLTYADKIQDLGERSENPTWEDFATLSAQYRRAFAKSLPTYTPQDNWLSETAGQLMYMINYACAATGS